MRGINRNNFLKTIIALENEVEELEKVEDQATVVTEPTVVPDVDVESREQESAPVEADIAPEPTIAEPAPVVPGSDAVVVDEKPVEVTTVATDNGTGEQITETQVVEPVVAPVVDEPETVPAVSVAGETPSGEPGVEPTVEPVANTVAPAEGETVVTPAEPVVEQVAVPPEGATVSVEDLEPIVGVQVGDDQVTLAVDANGVPVIKISEIADSTSVTPATDETVLETTPSETSEVSVMTGDDDTGMGAEDTNNTLNDVTPDTGDEGADDLGESLPESAPEEPGEVAEEDAVVIEPSEDSDISSDLNAAADNHESDEEKVEDIDDDIEDAEGDALTLESFAELIESSMMRGGLDPVAAGILKNSVNNIMDRYNFGKSIGLPAMEAFDDAETKIAGSVLALEDIKETASKIWEAIKKAIIAAAKFVSDMFARYVSSAGRLHAAATKIEESLDKLEATPKNTTFISDSLTKSLLINGKIPVDIANEFKKITTVMSEAIGPRAELEYKAFNELLAESKSITSDLKSNDDAKIAAAMERMQTIIDKIGAEFNKDLVACKFKTFPNTAGEMFGIEPAPEGTSLALSGVTFGETVIWVYKPDNVAELHKFRSGTAVRSDAVGSHPSELKVLSKDQIKAITSSVKVFTEKLVEYKKIIKESEALTRSVATMQVSSNVQDSDLAGVKQLVAMMYKNTRAIMHLMKGVHQPASKAATASAFTVLKYAAASVKNYNTDAVEKTA